MNRKMSCRFLLTLVVTGVLNFQPIIGADRFDIERAHSLPTGTPWDLDELSKPPEFKWADGREIHSLYYTGDTFKDKPTRVFAYYATPGSLAGDPSLDKNLPAIVLVHGGGGHAFNQWVRLWAARGYAAIAMDLAGCGPDNQPLADGGPDQSDQTKFGAIDQPVTDQWTYHAVANVIKAHSLIRSFPEVDPERTAVTGISWGGYLTCIVAGLDNRFAAAVPVYGCGFLHLNSCWLPQFDRMSARNRATWVRLWDPSQYIGSAGMPMLFVNGGTDFAYPPDSFARTYSLVQSPRTIRFSPELSHGHIFDRPRAIEVFIDHHLRQGLPLARIASVTLTAEQVTATVASDSTLVDAHLYYTLDRLPGDPKQRTWIERPAAIQQNQLTADLPPAHTVIWFLTVTDDRDTTISSELVFPDMPDMTKARKTSTTPRPELPGLSAQEGKLTLRGRPYCGMGANYFSLFSRALKDPLDASFETGLRHLSEAGIPFVRFMACAFWPAEWDLYLHDKAIETNRVPLSAFWVYDYPAQKDDWNVTWDNERHYMLTLVSQANQRLNALAQNAGMPDAKP